MSNEKEIGKAAIEKDAYDHYVKVIDGMMKWCVYKQPEQIDLMFNAFKVNKRELTIKAVEDVLKKWKDADENV